MADLQSATPRSRRAVLAAAVGGIGTLIASALGRPTSTRAAAGDNLVIGASNDAATSQTVLLSGAGGAAFTLKDSYAGGTGVFGWASATTGAGRALYGRADSANGFALQARNNAGSAGAGAAIEAIGNSNTAVIASTSNASEFAIRALNPGEGFGKAIFAAGQVEIAGGNGIALYAGSAGTAIQASSTSGVGVLAHSENSSGVSGSSYAGKGVLASSSFDWALYVLPDARVEGSFQVGGDAAVEGNLTKGGGAFKIDHPLDPANRYLQHSFVESPDMKNVYDGLVTLDARGEATVELPSYFEVLNRDVRYQLTPIGAPAPDLHVATELADRRFFIAGGRARQAVSWQVTGIRRDPWAEAHRIVVEPPKRGGERGTYLHPELYSQPAEVGYGHLARVKGNLPEFGGPAMS
jgi:hypothetical protein